MKNYKEEINEISKTVRGKFISSLSIKYDDEINDLINNPGSQEFILRSSHAAKAEFLSYANLNNFFELIKLLPKEEFFDISANATIDQLRAILNKILISEKSQEIFFNNDLIEKINHLDDEKLLLIKGFLKRMPSAKSDGLSTDDHHMGLENDFKKIKTENTHLKYTHKKIIDELNSKINFLEKENAEAIQKRIDDNLSVYVSDSVATLNKIEQKLKDAAARWSFFSIVVLFSGFSAGIGFSLFGYAFGPDLKDLKWPELLIFSIKGIFIVSAFVAAAGYSFMKSNAFTHEAIIVSNRAHAIQFGKLYLEIYGNTVERGEMQKIFENWNISSDTAFLKNKNEKSDPVKFAEFLDAAKKVKELIPMSGKD